jgi:hypothetical protein
VTVTPNVPPVETTPKAAIVASQTPLDMVNAAINDPLIAAVLTKYLGTSAHGPAASVIAGGLTALAAHFGLSLTPDETLWLSGVVALLAGYGWNWFAAKVLTPATPMTRGTT